MGIRGLDRRGAGLESATCVKFSGVYISGGRATTGWRRDPGGGFYDGPLFFTCINAFFLFYLLVKPYFDQSAPVDTDSLPYVINVFDQ